MLLRRPAALLLFLLTLPSPCVAQASAVTPSTPFPSRTLAVEDTEAVADALLARGAYAEALTSLQQIQPRSAVVWNKIGIAYHHLFAMDQAMAAYKTASSLNPHYGEALNNMGAIYYGKQEFSAAEKAYKRSLKYQPRSAGTYSNLGTLYFARKKYKKGVKAYQQAFALDPDVFNPARRLAIEEPTSREQRMATDFYMAEMYASAGKQDEALTWLRKALGAGFSDRKRLREDRELASLRGLPEFRQMLADGHLD